MIRPYTENDIDRALHEIAADDPSHALRIMQPPRDGVSDAYDELPCADAPTGYHHIDGSEASPWSGPGIALAIVVFGTVWLILKEVVQ